MRRPARHGGWPSAPASSTSKPRSSRPRADAAAKRQALENAEAELKVASAAESSAREAARNAQREANAARERHATAEREINRHASHRLGHSTSAPPVSPPIAPRPMAHTKALSAR